MSESLSYENKKGKAENFNFYEKNSLKYSEARLRGGAQMRLETSDILTSL